MTWKELLDQGRVERRATTRQELVELHAVAQRSLADARVPGFESVVLGWIQEHHPQLI